MGLESAISTALSGLKANQQALSVLSHNIANVNTPGYSAETVNLLPAVTQGIGEGVDIASVGRLVDNTLASTIRTQASVVSMSTTVKNYNDQIQQFIGSPSDSNTLNTMMSNFFTSLNNLSSQPALASYQTGAVNAGVQLASTVSTLASNLQQLRYSADQEYNQTISAINSQLSQIASINSQIKQALNVNADGTPPVSLLDTRDGLLSQLAQNIDITVNFSAGGTANINTADGKPLLDSTQLYQINYTPAVSVGTISNNTLMNQTTISTVGTANGSSTKSSPNTIILATSGVGSGIVTDMQSGKLKGLMQMRDIDIPKIIAQLNNLATNLTTSINAIHNNGAGFPPASTLTGTTQVSSNTNLNFNGSVRIAVLDNNGLPLTNGNGTNLNPLTLNLGTLDSGNGVGSPDVQTIINQINQYYDYTPTSTTTKLGNLSDIKLVATSQGITPNTNSFSFDFQLNNDSGLNSDFTIQSVQVVDSNGAVLFGTPPTLPSAYTSLSGTNTRTNMPMTVDMSGGTGHRPYMVQAQVEVKDSNGNISSSVISYPIPDSPANPNIKNTPFNASSATLDGVIVPPNNNVAFARASLVDSAGNPVAAGQPGFLQIATTSGNFHLAIDQLDSKQTGGTGLGATPTGQGFSQYFGLNNFFIPSSSQSQSALGMAVRPDIIANPSLFSVGQLAPTAPQTQAVVTGITKALGNIKFAANPSVGDTITINGKSFTFTAAGVPLPPTATNQIELGATLPATISNIEAVLGNVNSYTAGFVDKATYSDNGVDTLTLTASAAGTAANSINFSMNLAATTAIINGGSSGANPSGSLAGGTDESLPTTITPHTYTLGPGNNQAVTKMASLALTPLTFPATDGNPKSTVTLGGYTGNIISFAANLSNNANINHTNQQSFQDGYTTKYQSETGVNLDEELANTVVYQNAYSASARIVTTVNSMYTALFGIFQ